MKPTKPIGISGLCLRDRILAVTLSLVTAASMVPTRALAEVMAGYIVSDDGSRPGRGKRLRCRVGKHLLHLPHHQRKLHGWHLRLRRLGHAVGVGAREGRQRPHRPRLPHLPVAGQL